jgi:hypothetical protein
VAPQETMATRWCRKSSSDLIHARRRRRRRKEGEKEKEEEKRRRKEEEEEEEEEKEGEEEEEEEEEDDDDDDYDDDYLNYTTGMSHLRFIKASRGCIHKYENLKRKSYNCNTNTRFNRQCLQKQLIPN